MSHGKFYYTDGRKATRFYLSDWDTNSRKIYIIDNITDNTRYAEDVDQTKITSKGDDIFVFMIEENLFEKVLIPSGQCEPYIKMGELLETKQCIGYGYIEYVEKEPIKRDNGAEFLYHYISCTLYDRNLKNLMYFFILM